MEFYLLDPVLNIFKSLALVDGICQYYSHSSSVVCLGYCLELLLTSCVPNLQPDFMLSYHDSFDFEVDADGGEVRGHEVVITEFEEHIGFSDSAVADD